MPDMNSDLLEKTQTSSEVKPDIPWECRVYNDDFSPGELLGDIVADVFELSHVDAAQKLMVAHTTGMVVLAMYPEEEAKSRVAEATRRTADFGTRFEAVKAS